MERVADRDEPARGGRRCGGIGSGTRAAPVGLASGVAVPPLVSIVVTAYNEELTIVESIRALLALDYEPREVVIVNDGSTDGTLALAATDL